MASPAEPFDRRNLLTYVSLLCGIGAVAAAGSGRAWTAGLAIAIAVIADTFDGRFARRFGSDPRRNALGTELDSLSDAIAFGIAPPLCSVLLLNAGTGATGIALWIAVFVHAACAISRLASYNVDAMLQGPPPPPASPPASPKPLGGEGGKPRSGEGGFTGIPVPLAALIWSTALLVQPSAAVTLGVILVTAAAMVLPIRIPRPTGVGLAVFALWPLAVAILHASVRE